jgi:hypothetical protein
MLRGGVALVLLATVLASGAQAEAVKKPSRLALMVLPRAAFGHAAAALPVDAESGQSTRDDEVRTADDPRVTRASIARDGRLGGYGFALAGVPALRTGAGLASAGTEVELFRSSRGARAYARLVSAVTTHPRGNSALQALLAGLKVRSFRIPGLAHQAFAVRIQGRLGRVDVTESAVGIRIERTFARLNVVEAGAPKVPVNALARALERRVARGLAGELSGRPERLPSYTRTPLGRLGRPRGAPDLAHMALAPADFKPRAKLQHQGYRRNRDDVAEFVRSLGPFQLGRSVIARVESDVELRRSTAEALGEVASVGLALGGPRGRAVFDRTFGDGHTIEQFTVDAVSAGDAAFAVRATQKTAKGRVESAVVQVAVGRVLQTVAVASLPGLLSTDDLAAAARLIAAHMRAQLG